MSVGVIVPVYGPAPYLEEALAGVFGQSPAPEEVVVVDDGSPSAVRVPESLRRAAECCGGIGAADRGRRATQRLRRSRPSWIACADADDVWRPGKLAAQLRALERSGEALLCFGTAEIVGPDGRATGERWATLPAGLLEPGFLGRCCTSRTRSPLPVWWFGGTRSSGRAASPDRPCARTGRCGCA